MKIIALEEHFQIPAVREALTKMLPGAQDSLSLSVPRAALEDLGTGRLHSMDSIGIDVQILSYTPVGLPPFPEAEEIALTREINDQLATAIAAYPERFAGFAALPMLHPEAAAAEFERCVNTLGFKGALINGRWAGNRFLDDPSFSPILETAATLNVPIYLHPAPPSKAVSDDYYMGFDPAVSGIFAIAGWGWHVETGVHALRMILGGVFDRYPGLQIILGHWGEMIPFYLARVNEMITPVAKKLQRPVGDYFLQQMYATPSGMYTIPPFLLTLEIMGADRILYSVDYPFIETNQARAFLEHAPISPADKEKIAHGNAEKILKLAPM